MSTFDGAGNHPLLTDWNAWQAEPERVWSTEYADLADRGVSLACNDAFIAALVKAHILGTLGASGLRSTSMYDEQRDEAETTDRAGKLRRALTAITDRTWYGRRLDAEGLRSRMELEVACAWSAFVKGEGWLIRTMRGTRSVWRMVDPCRIKNPDNKPNSATLRDGFQLDTDGAVIGVWVVRSKLGKWGMPEDGKAIFVPWNAADGTPNIVYRKGYQLPGMMRAVSRLAPMIVLSRQIKGVVESHVAAKRLQAIYGMVTEAESPEAYAEAVAAGTALNPAALEVNGPLCAWVIPTGGKVTFTDTKFNGADLKDFLTICYKIQCATVATPVDVVLCQMGEASLSSARAGLDQFDRTCQAEQDAHIAECSSVIDHAAIMDEVATGAIAPLVGDPADTLAAKYSRPAKYSTDRLKDANTIDALMKSGVSGTTAFAMFGLIYEDEREVAAAERGFESAQGTTATQQKDAAFIERVVAANEKINAAGIESLEWPIVVAAGAADTAPGAFIGALAKPDATGAPTSEPGQPATPATAPAQTAAPATEGQTTSARSWWRAAIARVRGQRFAA